MSYIVTVVPARGRSRGLAGKNLATLGGVPLIAHSIGCAAAVPGVARRLVSTDSPEIAAVARRHGAEILMRPAELAADDTPMLPVLAHAIDAIEREGKTVDVLVLLQPTSPLREPADVIGALALYAEGGCDGVIGVAPARKSPYRNMVVPDGRFVRPLLQAAQPSGRRQDDPPAYDITGAIYVFSRAAIMEERSVLPRRARMYVMPAERAVDIDTVLDLEIAEFLLGRRARMRVEEQL